MKDAKKILIVEDEAIVAETLKLNLEFFNFSMCKPVATGMEALQFFEKEAPDLVLMDIRLAGPMNGLDVAKKIRETSDVPIIFITGYYQANI
ncbi:response regulator, partial [bacterium]|nr:response regulator [candidate division CSSED10-310 bacterium]